MARKLRVELDVDSEKAKRKVKNAVEEASATGGASVTGGASGAADHAAKSLKNLGDAAKETNINMKSVAKAFAGIGVGLATSYAANYMKPGAGRDAVEYGASAVTGAAMGAMVGGPVGAVVGGAAGLVKTYLDKEGERKSLSEDFEKNEKIYSASKAQEKRLRDLTDTRRGGGTTASLAALRKGLENYEKSIEGFVAEVRKELEKGSIDKERVADLRRNIGYSRQMAERYKNAIEQIEFKGSGEARESMDATDALQKIGGMMAAPASQTPEPSNSQTLEHSNSQTSSRGFAFSVPVQKYEERRFGDPVGGFDAAMKAANDQLEKLEKETNDLLKSIDNHIQGKDTAATWQ